MGLRVGVGEDTGVRLKHSSSSSSLSLVYVVLVPLRLYVVCTLLSK